MDSNDRNLFIIFLLIIIATTGIANYFSDISNYAISNSKFSAGLTSNMGDLNEIQNTAIPTSDATPITISAGSEGTNNAGVIDDIIGGVTTVVKTCSCSCGAANNINNLCQHPYSGIISCGSFGFVRFVVPLANESCSGTWNGQLCVGFLRGVLEPTGGLLTGCTQIN